MQPGFLLPAVAASEKTNANLGEYLKLERYFGGLAKGKTESLPRISSICLTIVSTRFYQSIVKKTVDPDENTLQIT